MGRALRVSALVSALVLASAGPASAVVLVNAPAKEIFCTKPITLGVWYQEYSGGSRAYTLSLYNPAGRRIFRAQGLAPVNRWLYFKLRPIDYPGVPDGFGTYKSVYKLPGVAATVFRTRVLCGE